MDAGPLRDITGVTEQPCGGEEGEEQDLSPEVYFALCGRWDSASANQPWDDRGREEETFCEHARICWIQDCPRVMDAVV